MSYSCLDHFYRVYFQEGKYTSEANSSFLKIAEPKNLKSICYRMPKRSNP